MPEPSARHSPEGHPQGQQEMLQGFASLSSEASSVSSLSHEVWVCFLDQALEAQLLVWLLIPGEKEAAQSWCCGPSPCQSHFPGSLFTFLMSHPITTLNPFGSDYSLCLMAQHNALQSAVAPCHGKT